MAVSGRHRGWYYHLGNNELQAVWNGTERMAINGTGLSFFQAAPAAQQAHIADVTVTGTYTTDDTPIETAINSIIAVLETFGLTATS